MRVRMWDKDEKHWNEIIQIEVLEMLAITIINSN